MHFDKDYQIHKAASKDPGRFAFNGVLVEADKEDPTKGRMVATNGRILAVVPCDLAETDVVHRDDADATPRPIIPAASIKAARMGGGKGHDAVVELDGKAVAHGRDGDISADYIEGESLDWRAVVPKEDGTVTLRINPKLLLAMAEAIGTPECVGLTFTPNEQGNVMSALKAETADGAIGVIMPITS